VEKEEDGEDNRKKDAESKGKDVAQVPPQLQIPF
jgi:hypothetical protein